MNKQQILKESIVIFDKYLQQGLKDAMKLTLKKLFSKAEVASSNQQEQELFNQYRQLKNGAKQFSGLIRTKIKEMPDFISAEVNKSDSKMSLSLVEDEELSISLALTQLDSTLEVVSHAELYTLEKRMNLIFENEKIDKTNMPFSPASVVWLFSHAFTQIEFDVPVKTMIVENLVKEFSDDINEAYHEINAVFIKAGILPNIKPEMIRPKSSGQDGQAAQDQAIDQTATDEQSASVQSGAGQVQGGGSGPSGGAAGQPGSLPGQAGGHAVHQSGSAGYPAGGSAGGNVESGYAGIPGQSGQTQQEARQLVESIFDLLSPPRGSAVSQNSDAVSQQSVANVDIDQALEQIGQDTGVVATSKNIGNLKEMLTDQVRNNTGNYYPELSPRQHKTLDLMGMVYDEIENDKTIDTHIRSSFNAINVPLLRTAIKDESFFTDNGHPARKFMELLVESSQKWHGTNVIKKIHQYSDTAAKSFDGSTQSFVKALEELTQYLKVTQTRAERAEQKWISAAEGKEKMDITKAQVDEHLQDILEGCDIKFIRDIVDHVWRDSLTLTLLREGKDSQQWDEKIDSAKTIAQIGNKMEFMKLSGPDKLKAMHQLDQTMDELGFSKRDRLSTKDNIHMCLSWQESDELNKEEKKPSLKKVLSIDEAVKTAEIETANKKIEDIRELSDEEKEMRSQVVNMPYGTLFDFIINQQNDVKRRKLSWVSTVSDRVLFVDLIGRHPHKMKLARLAIDLCRKNIIRVQLPEGGYFKNALNRIVNRLKKLAA
ncbi:DUF1631 family protein [Marinicella sediminis]|uniref:DUF1631 family protein n=1 Tax=Marinicella sediminis TaxID=1792834 RepID=A0ABV7J7S5_9GAMM|nr:DUF1631 family protein [Marinicella sediminis]